MNFQNFLFRILGRINATEFFVYLNIWKDYIIETTISK